MEAGETRANVCKSLNIAPATVSTIITNTDKIKESMQKVINFKGTRVSYSRSSTMERMEHLLALWVDDLNQQKIPVTERAIASKAKSLFDDIQREKGGTETVAASKDEIVEDLLKQQIIRELLETSEHPYYELRIGLVYRKCGSKIHFYVPKCMEFTIIYTYHAEMGHFGVDKTLELFTGTDWFAKMREKIQEFIRNCLKCIEFNRKSEKPEGYLHSIPKGNAPFETIHIDNYGPLPRTRRKYNYLFEVIDGFTKFIKLFPCKSTDTQEVLKHLNSYFRNYSRPKVRNFLLCDGLFCCDLDMESFARQNPKQNTNVPIKKTVKIHKREIERDARVSGEPFVNIKGKHIPPRETGPDCRCVRFKCFERVSVAQRNQIIKKFNALQSKNEQDSHLAGLVSFRLSKQRRSRVHHQDVPENEENNADANINAEEPLLRKYQRHASYFYKIRNDGNEIPVCAKAFCSLHGISQERVRRIKKALFQTGESPRDLRGRHDNRPRKTETGTLVAVRDHIKSFKCIQSHYSRRDNPNTYYLPETLTVKEMHKIFLDENPNKPVSYKIYWKADCGEWERSYIRNKKCIPKEIQFEQQYFETIPLKKQKIDNFIHLSKFIKRPQNIAFYKAFISMLQKKPVGDSSSQDKVEVIDDDNSSGESDPEENC
ncbi:Integrase zinc binding domain [Popillia japonica]|uniref:RNA-directed DNA polymerase n=1 Tax=Popillia japonica TaxID=7064 RepID=A0AAW1J2D1_POPJA